MQERASTATPSDEELLRRTAAGDRDAFAALYHRYQASIYRFARLMTGSAAAAEDVVQEVFLALMKQPSRYDAARATLSTYLYGVARHHTRRRLRRERRFVAIETAAGWWRSHTGDHDGAAAMECESELQRLRAAILSLPSRYREAVVLCDLEGLTYEQAAAAAGCALGTVRSRLHRARQLLAAKMRAGASPRTASPIVRCPV